MTGLQGNLRFSTELTEQQIKDRVASVLDRHGLRYELSWRLSGAPFMTDRPELIEAVQQALTQRLGTPARPDTGGGTSDGRFIAPTGAQVVELGPLSASIHKVNEHVAVADIEALSEVYEQVLVNLLGS